MPKRAKLDHDLVYWGPEDVDEFAEGDIEAPDECIRPGAYRWNTEHLRWDPLEPTQVKLDASAPSLERAFYDLLTVGPDAPSVRAWGEAYRKTLEGAGR